MDVTIAPDVQSYIEEKVRSGQFKTAAEVIEYAVDRLREREEQKAWLRGELQKGIESLERGEGAEWDVEATKARLLQRHLRQSKEG